MSVPSPTGVIIDVNPATQALGTQYGAHGVIPASSGPSQSLYSASAGKYVTVYDSPTSDQRVTWQGRSMYDITVVSQPNADHPNGTPGPKGKAGYPACKGWDPIADARADGLTPTNCCLRARCDAGSPQHWFGQSSCPQFAGPPTPAMISAGQDVFFFRTTIAFDPGFPAISAAYGGHYTLHEWFGRPFNNSGGGPVVLIQGGTNQIIVNGMCCNIDGTQPGPHNFWVGPTTSQVAGKFVDMLFQIRGNTLHVDPVTKNNVPNYDGWFSLWVNVNSNPKFTINPSTDQKLLGSTTQQFGTQSNVKQLKFIPFNPGGVNNIGQSTSYPYKGYSYPLESAYNNQALNLYYTMIYTGADVDAHTYFGRQMVTYDLASALV
jgi:hypothetical protein